MKILQTPNFKNYRESFLAKLEKMFISPANTFDNVKGNFPIGFKIWNTKIKTKFNSIFTDVYDSNGNELPQKNLICVDDSLLINDWINKVCINSDNWIGCINIKANDFQHNSNVCIGLENVFSKGDVHKYIHKETLFSFSVYFSVRFCIEQSWLNDRDQFLYPNDNWKADKTFQSNCLIYTLFHGQNRISSEQGDNHWIPFTREQFGCKKTLKSKFMSSFIKDFLDGKVDCSDSKKEETLFENQSVVVLTSSTIESEKITLSKEAQDVYDSGLELWKYYHIQTNANPNASFYDIRKYFQGTNDKGKMNLTSNDEKYTELIGDLRDKMKSLAKAIEPKVYEYGFLK